MGAGGALLVLEDTREYGFLCFHMGSALLEHPSTQGPGPPQALWQDKPLEARQEVSRSNRHLLLVIPLRFNLLTWPAPH